MKTRKVAIVQARTSSSRLPGKVLMPLNGKPMIVYLLERLRRCSRVDRIVMATSTEEGDNELCDKVKQSGFFVFRGDLDDVLKRYKDCSEEHGATTVIRITGDCPLMDPDLVDEMIEAFEEGKWDYLANCADENELSVPDGFDIEVFKADLLIKADKEARLLSEREHVTPWFRSEVANLRWSHYVHRVYRDFFRVTVDDKEDMHVVRTIVNSLEKKYKFFGVDDVINYLRANPDIANVNSHTKRNEGYDKSIANDGPMRDKRDIDRGQELWSRAKKVIPGGNMLLSKRPEMFLPGKWPSYYSRSKGCRVWDTNGREFIDMSIMGIGTNLLGYGNVEVDEEVKKVVEKGNMSTLNCPEEVELAERMIDIHPWADMARFARSGGEANAIAIRIARAATGREKVAVCGYHGWHDWYLATNLKTNSGLEEHLLPGLDPNGVPSGLEGTVLPFSFNQIEQIEEIAKNHDLAAIKMEVQRSTPPKPGFLERIRKICDERGIVLIFDECTSGFRETFGGLHLKYNVNPDMAMFGKALGNGYAITAIIGSESVMQATQNTFISSTFWTERIGPTAALKTLEVMEKTKSWEIVTETGMKIRSKWQELANKYRIKIIHNGIPALTGFSFESTNTLKYKTYITQEMLKKGYLAATSCYVSTAHDEETIKGYFEALEGIFDRISECEQGRPIDELLEGPICHDGFKRLN